MEKPEAILQTERETFLQKEVEVLRQQLVDLQAENDLKAFILDSIPDYVSYVDADLTYRFCNRKYETEKGMTREKFLGKHVIEFVGKQGLTSIQPYVDRVLKGDLVTYEDHIDYKYLAEQDVQVQYAPQLSEDGTVIGFSVYVRNITAQHRAEEMLRRQAQHDPLTELPNRILFNSRLEQAIGLANRISGQLAVLFIDLDGFKQVNDAFGHEIGDQVLQDVATKLVENVRCSDTLARIGGDEFVLLIEGFQSLDQVRSLAKKIVESISSLHTPVLQKVKISASIGISLYPDHGTDPRTLLVRADEAMYEAKRQGKQRYFLYCEDAK